MMINLLPVQVDDILLTGCAGEWAEVPLAEHGVVDIGVSSLACKKLHDLSDLLAELCETSHNILFVGKLVQNLLDHISQFIHDSLLKVFKVLLAGLLVHLILKRIQSLVSLISMVVELVPELGELVVDVV